MNFQLVSSLNALMTLMSFGVVYPPLCVVTTIGIFFSSLHKQFVIGSLLIGTADLTTREQYVYELNAEGYKIVKAVHGCIWYGISHVLFLIIYLLMLLNHSCICMNTLGISWVCHLLFLHSYVLTLWAMEKSLN